MLDAALDPVLPPALRPARRCGVIHTAAVAERTVLLLARFRFHLTLPSRSGDRPLVAEDARVLGVRGLGFEPRWLPDEDVTRVLAAAADANVAPELARVQAERVIAALPRLADDLDARADALAEQLAASHRRARLAGGERTRLGRLRVAAQRPVDVLGVYVYQPLPPGGPGAPAGGLGGPTGVRGAPPYPPGSAPGGGS